MIDRAVEIIEAVLEEGIAVGKDAGDVPEWETKPSMFHADRAHAHLNRWIWYRKNKIEKEVNLQHALVRLLMAILRLEDEKAHSG